MPRTVDTSSTLENFRVEHNNLATDIGAIGNLTTGDTSSVVNAINYIMDQYFFFQDFDFDGSDGATSNTVFSGNDNTGNTLQYSSGKVLVYKNGLLLRNGTDYTASNGTSITLGSSANNGDVIRVSSYTGSYQNVNSESSAAFDAWQSAGGVIYNKNTGGIVFNADASITTTPTVDSSFQFDGPSYHNDHVHVNAVSSSPKELRFRDADNSNYAGIKAPATIAANYTLTLPTDDGTSGQLLSTNGSGVLSWAAAGTAPDITITANNSADETVYPVFVDGATGTQGLESDTGLSYNPSSGMLTSTGFTGALTGTLQTAAQPNITSVGTISTGVWQGTAIAATYIADDIITHNKIADDAIRSEHYSDGSIDTAHIADSQITQVKMASDSVTAANIADNAVGASELNVSGNGSADQALLSDGDGTFSWGSSGHTTEELQDIIGDMFSSNTETRISATYNDGGTDGTGKINLEVDDMTANTTYTAGTGMTLSGTTFNCSITDTNTTYTAGTNMSLSGTEFSSTDTNTTYTAGTNMTLSGTEFSSTDTVYTHPASAGNKHVPTGGSSGEFLKYSSNGTAVWATPSYTTNTNTTYTAGTGMTLSGTTFNCDITDTNTTYTAGSNMSLSGTEFSSTDTNTTYSAGGGTSSTDLAGIYLSGTTFELGSDYRDKGTLIWGNNTGDYIDFGVTADTMKFFIATNERMRLTTGTTHFDGDVTAYSTTISSDINLKDNIEIIPSALDKLSQVKGVTFNWKKDGKASAGVIAQDIEKILPSAVTEHEQLNSDEVYKHVDYNQVIGLLVESIKELKSELDDLKSSNS